MIQIQLFLLFGFIAGWICISSDDYGGGEENQSLVMMKNLEFNLNLKFDTAIKLKANLVLFFCNRITIISLMPS